MFNNFITKLSYYKSIFMSEYFKVTFCYFVYLLCYLFYLTVERTVLYYYFQHFPRFFCPKTVIRESRAIIQVLAGFYKPADKSRQED